MQAHDSIIKPKVSPQNYTTNVPQSMVSDNIFQKTMKVAHAIAGVGLNTYGAPIAGFNGAGVKAEPENKLEKLCATYYTAKYKHLCDEWTTESYDLKPLRE